MSAATMVFAKKSVRYAARAISRAVRRESVLVEMKSSPQFFSFALQNENDGTPVKEWWYRSWMLSAPHYRYYHAEIDPVLSIEKRTTYNQKQQSGMDWLKKKKDEAKQAANQAAAKIQNKRNTFKGEGNVLGGDGPAAQSAPPAAAAAPARGFKVRAQQITPMLTH